KDRLVGGIASCRLISPATNPSSQNCTNSFTISSLSSEANASNLLTASFLSISTLSTKRQKNDLRESQAKIYLYHLQRITLNTTLIHPLGQLLGAFLSFTIAVD